MNRPRYWLMSAVGVLGLVAPAFAQDPVTQGDRVVLVYDDRRMGDADRAALLTFVAEFIPESAWQTVRLPRATDLRQVVNAYYDFFQFNDFRAPLTAAAAVEALQEASDIDSIVAPAGSTLRLPPFPVRAFGRFEQGRAFRLFNAEAHAYAIRQNSDEVSVPDEPLIGNVAEPAIRARRAATATGIALPSTAALAEAIAAGKLPRGVSPFSLVSTGDDSGVIGTVSVELLETAMSGCGTARGVLEGSSFIGPARARVKRVLATRKERLLELARSTPLTLIDVGFGTHHGSKVRRVVAEVLGLFEADVLRDHIREIELYPVDDAAADALGVALTEYVASKQAPAEAVPGEFAARVAQARRWIENSRKAALITGQVRLDIPEVLLQAVFWKQLSRGGWVNMSFRMRAPAMHGLLPAFARGAVAFGVSAVRNTVEAIQSGWLPQDVSTANPNFINVTYGTESGEVRAQYTSGQEDGTRVPVLAPGCGFDGIDEEGSSLASPYVAAASWLRALLDAAESGAPVATMNTWRLLLAATRPIPALSHSVESGGMFDAAMLVAPPATEQYLVMSDNTLVPIAEFRLDAVCVADGVTFEQPFTSAPIAFRMEARTFALYRDEQGETFLWRREVPLRDYGRARSGRYCRLTDLEFRATPVNGSPIHYRRGEMARFAREIAAVAW
jgi:hypothetical protein